MQILRCDKCKKEVKNFVANMQIQYNPMLYDNSSSKSPEFKHYELCEDCYFDIVNYIENDFDDIIEEA